MKLHTREMLILTSLLTMSNSMNSFTISSALSTAMMSRVK